MQMSKERYRELVDARNPRSPLGKNLFRAFWVGGLVCLVGELLIRLFSLIPNADPKLPPLLCSVTLIFAGFSDCPRRF